MRNKATILIADDDEKILYAFRELLKKDGHKSLTAKNGVEVLEKFYAKKPDVIFLDIKMPLTDGLEILTEIKKDNPHVPVIVITGFGTMQTAVKAIQLGAFDYLTKPLDLSKVRDTIRKALFTLKEYKSVFVDQTIYNADIVEKYDLIGNSIRMQEVFKLIGSISTTTNTTPVLIVGESGTGKELVARAIHNNSANSTEPFIAINCTAFPETLLESELLGFEKGSFTGASDRKYGKFELAGSGTIFLDEIGTLSLNLQQKLLRIIQSREFERIGGNLVLPIKARFIAATNIDIVNEVRNGRFREDLFYRLNVASVYLTPLRHRKEDILQLANYFLAKYNYSLNKSIRGFSDETIRVLSEYPFPGNVRELENIIERAVMLSKGDVILADSLKEYLYPVNKSKDSIPITDENFSESRTYVLELFEIEFLNNLLSKYRGNVSLSAKASKMTRQNFQRLMKKHNITSKTFKQ
ncbi:MAG: sigma-54 dependent transcriptional regulator [Ignavibacteriales bacterium]|nr:sigma-54 dependent transcriptional regulator [Ignavibacteriales bacterium]